MRLAYINNLNTDTTIWIIDKFEPDTSFKALEVTLFPDPHSLNFKQAMVEHHCEQFLKAMVSEVKQLQTH